MLKRSALLALFVLIAFSISAPAQAHNAKDFDGKSWWEHVKVLASDDMEGRETGSAGLRKASAYVVDQLKKSGLKPAGTDGFYQPVRLRSRQIDESGSSLGLTNSSHAIPLVIGEDAIFSTRVDLAPSLDAPLVFVGYGLRVPENNYDDLTGVDLKGKIAVYVTGSPADMPAALAAHFQSTAERARALRESGAVGIVAIPNPASMEVPWTRYALARKRPSMALADPSLDESAGMRMAVLFNPEHAEKLFTGSGHEFAEIAALAKDRKPLPRFPLAVGLQSKTKLISQELESSNIVAKFPGSDPKLKDEYVVLSAHLDHLGIGEPVNGDSIYNGAMDNASGSALLLDLAAAMHAAHAKPRRSLLFLFVIAEEKGLLGSKYFANHPTVPRASIVADINTDMFLPIVPLKVLTVEGLAESDLGDDAHDVAKQLGVDVQADPEPLRNLFVRSDQYSFIRQGIPSLAMSVGVIQGSPEAAVDKQWLKERYHAPSDDLNQPVDLAAAGKYEDVMSALARKVADSSSRPKWKSDSFFRRFVPQALADH